MAVLLSAPALIAMLILPVQELSHPWGRNGGGKPRERSRFFKYSHEIADSGSMNAAAPDVAPRGGSVTENSKKLPARKMPRRGPEAEVNRHSERFSWVPV